MQSESSTVKSPPPEMARAVEVARAYLDEHFAERVLLEDLGKVAAVSPFHLSRLFKAVVGVAPHRYLMRVRMARAVELLCGTDLTVSQIAQRVGFSSMSHFTLTFRSEVGLTPTAFRRAHRNGSHS